MSTHFTQLFTAGAVLDASGVLAAPGAVLIRCEITPGTKQSPDVRLLACGAPSEVERHPDAARAERVQLPGQALIPPLVNAHTHLDLSHVGPRPFDREAGFAGWVGLVLRERLHDEAAIRDSVRTGVELSLRAGVGAVGDIAGIRRTEAVDELRRSPLWGVSFLEVFGMGRNQEATIDFMRAAVRSDEQARGGTIAPRVRLGLSPHAPYTAGLRVFDAAVELSAVRGLPICTHLAETPEERRFVAHGDGPFRAVLERLNVWDESILHEVGMGRHPVGHLKAHLARAPMLLAHVNDTRDPADPAFDAIEVLARTRCAVAYCPRSSHYFCRHEDFGPHRYREMLAAGITVALGTDSIINIPPEQADRLSTLDEARFLFARDRTDPRTLLAMATTLGARALGMNEELFSLAPPAPGRPRQIAGVLGADPNTTNAAGDPLDALLRGSGQPRWLAGPGCTPGGKA